MSVAAVRSRQMRLELRVASGAKLRVVPDEPGKIALRGRFFIAKAPEELARGSDGEWGVVVNGDVTLSASEFCLLREQAESAFYAQGVSLDRITADLAFADFCRGFSWGVLASSAIATGLFVGVV